MSKLTHRRIPVRRKWNPLDDKLLGTATDSAIARKLGHSRFTVVNRRRKLGIEAFAWTNYLRKHNLSVKPSGIGKSLKR